MKIIELSLRNRQKAVKEAVKALKKEKVIVCPTDTVYGLMADATRKKAVEKIFKIKKRPKNKFLPIFVKDIKTAKELAEINKIQEIFLKKSWPGKITAVLKRKKEKESRKIYGVGKKTIALRIPDYKLIKIFLEELKRPLAETSANISGQPSPVGIKDILKQFKGRKLKPDLIINGGDFPKNKSSAVIDLTILPPKTLRK